jgi:hypothetical protein
LPVLQWGAAVLRRFAIGERNLFNCGDFHAIHHGTESTTFQVYYTTASSKAPALTGSGACNRSVSDVS